MGATTTTQDKQQHGPGKQDDDTKASEPDAASNAHPGQHELTKRHAGVLLLRDRLSHHNDMRRVLRLLVLWLILGRVLGRRGSVPLGEGLRFDLGGGIFPALRLSTGPAEGIRRRQGALTANAINRQYDFARHFL